MTQAVVSDMWMFPVKGAHGFRAEYLPIDAKVGIVGDRRYGIRRSIGVPEGKVWAKKAHFYVGMNKPSMVSQAPLYQDGVCSPAWLEQLRQELQYPAALDVLDTEEDFNLTDTEGPTVSILNPASVEVLRKHMKVDEVDPLRFRMNIFVEGLEPFEELSWVTGYPGTKVIRIGHLRFRVIDACERCPATEANPRTGMRDSPVLKGLQGMMEARGYKSPHRGTPIVMGVIAQPLDDGTILQDDEVVVE